jgi:hypothetical protein
LYSLLLECSHLFAGCEPINIDEFSKCVESCAAREDKTKFDSDQTLKEYCVEQCVVTLRKCSYE